MASQALLDFVEELKDERDEILPQLEGLRDYARLNIKPETQPVIATAIEDYQRRLEKIDAALASCDALTNDGYPELPVREVVEGIYADLAENAATINAALAKFKAKAEAASVTIVPGTPQPKP